MLRKTNSLLLYLCCSFLLLLTSSIYSNSLVILNDSPYPLTATIIAADGQTKGSITVTPQQQSSWQDPSPSNATFSQTPYTVVFTCKNGKSFGVASGISQGAWVTAMQSQGSHDCGHENPEKQITPPLPPDQQHDLDLSPP